VSAVPTGSHALKTVSLTTVRLTALAPLRSSRAGALLGNHWSCQVPLEIEEDPDEHAMWNRPAPRPDHLCPLVNELAPEALRGRYNAVDSLVLPFGTLAGHVLAGVLLSGAGPSGLLAALVGGCLMAALVVCVCQGSRSLRAPAEPRLSPLAQPTPAGP
jgi:hypothetical protein